MDRVSGAPKGRIICAWCGRDLGPSGTRDDSHGVCAACEARLRERAGLEGHDD